VLSNFDGVEKAELPDVVERAIDALKHVARDGAAAAMNVVNTRKA
jgi:peptidyl-tRNA hydrolase